MSAAPSTLIIPVESQVREFDAKLLLACLAAERGFPVILGSRAYTHYIIGQVPRGVYLAKSMRVLSETMFRLLRMVGHEIVAWEEEALVHPPAETYFTLRLSPNTINKVSHVFAWGQENADLLKQYPHLPPNLPIHVTGNPRGDMLRPELRSYFDEPVEQLRAQYGRFVLINTNYSDVNPFIPSVGLFYTDEDGTERRGQAGIGLPHDFATGLRAHKHMLFHAFQAFIPQLAHHFQDVNIVVRPHPSENFDSYRALAESHPRVHVDASGNIIPWLLACEAMIHNGCTTGVEAYALGRPAIAYLPNLNEYYDFDFQGLPNRLTHQCLTVEQVFDTLRRILDGHLGASGGAEREALIDHYLAARNGALASERILDVLVASGYLNAQPRRRSKIVEMTGRAATALRARNKQAKHRRSARGKGAYHDHRFPELSVHDVERRVAALSKVLNRFHDIVVQDHSKHIFTISCRRPTGVAV
jgi:surface carbohydrate biosynthesis protein